MENELFDDLMLSLNQALEYTKGDKTKGRSIVIDTPEDIDSETDVDKMLWYKIAILHETQKQQLTMYVDELLESQ